MTGTQQTLDLGLEDDEVAVSVTADKKVTGSASRLLVDAIGACYDRLGFSAQVADEAFFQMVLARLVEPSSKRDSLRVVGELGVEAVLRNTFVHVVKRAQVGAYARCIATPVSTRSSVPKIGIIVVGLPMPVSSTVWPPPG